VNPELGALWVQRRSLNGNWMIFSRLKKLCARGEIGRRAVVGFAEILGEKSRPWLLWFLLRQHGEWMSKDTVAWGKAGYALVANNRFRAAVRWLGGWRNHANVEPWMLYNLAFALRRLGRFNDSVPVLDKALALPRDASTFNQLKLWRASEYIFNGDIAGGTKHLSILDTDKLAGRDKRHLALAQAVVDVASAPISERKKAWKAAKKNLTAVLGKVPVIEMDTVTRRTFRRAIGPIAGSCGKWETRIWAAWTYLRWWWLAVPFVALFALVPLVWIAVFVILQIRRQSN
jgi:hypothetical protein